MDAQKRTAVFVLFDLQALSINVVDLIYEVSMLSLNA